jgi:hypothetical protein
MGYYFIGPQIGLRDATGEDCSPQVRLILDQFVQKKGFFLFLFFSEYFEFFFLKEKNEKLTKNCVLLKNVNFFIFPLSPFPSPLFISSSSHLLIHLLIHLLTHLHQNSATPTSSSCQWAHSTNPQHHFSSLFSLQFTPSPTHLQ